jgi:hypothetical protein
MELILILSAIAFVMAILAVTAAEFGGPQA